MNIEQKRDLFKSTNSVIYSARSEVEHDYDLVREKLLEKPEQFPLLESTCKQAVFVAGDGTVYDDLPDRDLEFQFKEPVNHYAFLELVNGCTDCHVIQQSLRPVSLKENSLERDWDHSYAVQ